MDVKGRWAELWSFRRVELRRNKRGSSHHEEEPLNYKEKKGDSTRDGAAAG